MSERDVLYLEHIVDAIDRIREYTRWTTVEQDLQPLAETASKLLREARR